MMDITSMVENKGACRRLLKIEVSAADVKREMDKVYSALSREAKIPGFRAGRVPRDILALRLGGEAEKEVRDRIVSLALGESIRKHGLKIAGDARFGEGGSRVKEGEPFRFEVTVDLEPDFEMASYRGIKVRKKDASVSDEDVSRALEGLRERAARLATVEGRGLRAGDYAIVDIAETPSGGKVRSRSGVLIELDEARLIPGFCNSVAGMKPGEEKEFTLAAPAAAGKESGKKEVLFKVALKEIKEKVLPNVDDDFARELGDFKDLDALEKRVRENIVAQRRLEVRSDMEKQVMDELVERNSFDLPQSLVEHHARRAFEGQRARLRGLGIEVEPGSGKEDELRARAREAAERSIRELYIVRKVAEAESITVSDEELGARIDEIAGKENRSAGQVRASLEEEGLFEDLRWGMQREKVFSFLLEEARVR